VRRFTAEYLETTRDGMWNDSRDALVDLELASRQRVLDVGAGTGELTRVLREDVPGETVALDADASLLSHVSGPRIRGDATRLPFRDDVFDLVVCQALLVNLPDPLGTIREFTRVSNDCAAVVEPDNGAVSVESTVETEPPLARRARELYLDGVATDATLGAVPGLFEEAGLTDVTVRRYDHERMIEPPYTKQALESARRKANGAGIEGDRETILAGDVTAEAFDRLRDEWRAMGREVIEQMQGEEYRQREVVPFYVTVGHVP
jgi:SAM-dependent methyltransferase